MTNTTTYPYSAVVYITDTIGGQQFQASGVLISPDEVLTASHVVYSAGIGTATNIVVTPGYNGGAAPFGSAAVTSYHYMPVQDYNDALTGAQSQSDYAVLHLSRAFAVGTFGVLPGFHGGFANVTGYPGYYNGTQVSAPSTFYQDPYYTLLDGPALGPGSSGGPVWVGGAQGASVVGLVSTEDSYGGFDAQITGPVAATIDGWVAQDDSSGGNFSIRDTTLNQLVAAPATPYTGPVAGIAQQCIDITSDNLNISAATPNWFIHSGSGTDAIAVSSGTNVLDGGTGSNFLVGGSGSDTFFVDDRNARAPIWSTFDHFHAGDSATVWGVTPSGFQYSWADQQGASGYAGLTLHALGGGPEASLTIVGYATSDLSNGRLAVSFGIDQASGSAFLHIHAFG